MASRALEAALQEAGVLPQELRLVVATGVSRDYPPSWSMATEAMRILKIPHTCLGFDITIGCLGTLTGLNLAAGWLASAGGGVAAIVNAERWSQTIDRSSPSSQGFWGHADGGSAAVVTLGPSSRALATFHGATFASNSDFNDLVLIKYGGTRYPAPPPGERPITRQLRGDVLPREIWAAYCLGYGRAFKAFDERFGTKPTRLICNQISPKIVTMIGETSQVPDDRICRTGHQTGHVGSADVLIGLRALADARLIDGQIAVAGSTPYAFGAGLITLD
jgi:3-oxoacyl-[acyl-carrier-protein] synthase III